MRGHDLTQELEPTETTLRSSNGPDEERSHKLFNHHEDTTDRFFVGDEGLTIGSDAAVLRSSRRS